jgi:hypothetical protein
MYRENMKTGKKSENAIPTQATKEQKFSVALKDDPNRRSFDSM